MNAIIETNGSLITNTIFYKIGEYLQREWLLVNIKWKLYPNRVGYRKLALYLWISLEIKKESRIETPDYFLYEYSIRATTQDGRYTESSASCASNEKEFNHLENDVRATAQTRATNRAIADLLWLTDVTQYVSSSSSLPSQKASHTQARSEWSEQSEEIITDKQKHLLKKLISEIYSDLTEQNDLISELDELTKQEANIYIKELMEEKRNQS